MVRVCRHHYNSTIEIMLQIRRRVVLFMSPSGKRSYLLQLDFPFGSSVQVHHPTSYTASSGVFPRRIRTECVREVYGFLNEKEKLNCSTSLSPTQSACAADRRKPAAKAVHEIQHTTKNF